MTKEELLKLKEKVLQLDGEKKVLTGYPSIDKPNERETKFFERHPIIPGTNIYTIIQMLSMFYKEKTAISCYDLHVSYGQLMDNDAVRISLALKELGVRKGDIIAISMPNLYQAVASFIACNRIGAVATFLDHESGMEEICSYLNEFESPILINYDKSKEENDTIKRITKVRHIVTLYKCNINSLNIDKDYRITSKDEIMINFHSLGSIANERKFKLESPHFSNENAMILFTSGSTGKPKSVLLTNKNIIAAEIYAKNTSHTQNITGPRTLTCVPLRYPYSSVTSLLTTLLWGKEAILAPDIGPSTIANYMSMNPNIIFGSPALLELIMRNIGDNQDLSSVTHFISGGDFLLLPQYERGLEFFYKHGAKNVEIGDGFGNAETVSIQSTPVGVKMKPGTAGKLLVGTKYRLINPDTHEDVKYGEEGLLCVAGNHVFKEYYNQPELTKDAFITVKGKKYFNTGTLGTIDEDGYFKVTGRMSRFYIMSSLYKVYMDHVQSIITNLPCVDSCAVVAVPDEKQLFVNKAYIVLNKGYNKSDLLEKEILKLLNEPTVNSNGEESQLKSYEIPKYIEFVNELPRKKGTDKVDYSFLTNDAQKTLKKH